ncbi:hypothetical protein PV08_04689 [Exophiala spinifera]|uniref:Uncharacterized protein n=1 Tax=Exophiala spinifera TaxID=91928 RepID=A0A0D2BFY3_9EURO|nr:uncharacterized protein PV08_04689 [Exophiala spinifera]KIW17495.1 hypothetical protein PV08_04689 [Exophiala spinifera]
MQPSTEEFGMSLYERTQKAKKDLHKRNMAEHLAIATTYVRNPPDTDVLRLSFVSPSLLEPSDDLQLWQVHLANTNGGHQPEPLEGTYRSAVDMLKFDIEHGGKTIRELYHKNVLKNKPSRKPKSSKAKSKVSKEQARKEYLAQLKLEAEARLDARLTKNTIQEIDRINERRNSDGARTLTLKRKLSSESLNSSDSIKRQRTGSIQPITNMNKPDHEGETKRQKSDTPEKVAVAAPNDTQVVGGDKSNIHKQPSPIKAAAPANKRKRTYDDYDDNENGEPARNNVPAPKRIRGDHNGRLKAVKTPLAKQSETPSAISGAVEPFATGVPNKLTTPTAVAKPGPSNTAPKPKSTGTLASDQEGHKTGDNFVLKGGDQLRNKYKKKPLPPMMTKIGSVPKVYKPVFKSKKLLGLGDATPPPSP